MILFERNQPARDIDLYLLHRELKEQLREDALYLVFTQFHAADRQDRHLITRGKLFREFLCAFSVGIGGVEQKDKRLVYRLKLLNHTPLTILVVLARDLAEGAVGGDDKPDCGMIGYHLFCSDFRRLFKRDLLLRPRGFHHARRVLLALSQRGRHQIADAVDHSDAERRVVAEVDLNGLLGDKLRLCRHYRPARGRLRQLVNRAAVNALVADIRQDE